MIIPIFYANVQKPSEEVNSLPYVVAYVVLVI